MRRRMVGGGGRYSLAGAGVLEREGRAGDGMGREGRGRGCKIQHCLMLGSISNHARHCLLLMPLGGVRPEKRAPTLEEYDANARDGRTYGVIASIWKKNLARLPIVPWPPASTAGRIDTVTSPWEPANLLQVAVLTCPF